MMKPSDVIGVSEKWLQIHEEIRLAGPTDAKVLITGESGVGKEIVAQLIHLSSQRAHGRLVTLNCAGVPESLLESELFGHVRGSFTDAHRDKRGLLEQADGGTIFMDEIGEMSLRMQALLLRFLETGEIQPVGAHGPVKRVDTRLVAATNRDLLAQVSQGKFREDLYYRINVMHIPVPPLRERSEDVRALLDAFFERFATQYQRNRPVLTDEAWVFLRSFHWPGNVRQLKNVAERLVLRDFPRPIAVADLPREITEDALIEAATAATVVESGRPDRFDALMRGESFWTAVHEPFMSRDLTRDDLRQLVRRGLTHTHGSYRQLTTLFNLPPTDYKSLLNFLRKHDCHVPYKPFRTISGGAVPTPPAMTHSTMWTPNSKGTVVPHSVAKSA
jgi:transcriptional regulator with PAS, ATPase and Fis domain